MKPPRDVALVSAPARRHALRLGAGLAMAAALPPLAAQPPGAEPVARLRFRLERDATRLEVGEAIVVRLEVWVSSWFQAPVEFPATLAAEGALVEAVGGSPDSRFEDFGGRRWTGLIRRYRVLPAQPGELSVALPGPLPVLPGGGNGRPQRLAPPVPLRLTVRLPAGAEDIQPFVAARRLELRQRWWPDSAPGGKAAAPHSALALQVGDLVRREVLLVTDSTSPLLPAPDFTPPAGATVRVSAAELQERRTDAAATPTLTRRVEAVYTLQQAGEVVLPPIEMVWWDLARRKQRVMRLEGRTLEVRPAAGRADPFAVAGAEASAPSADRDTPSGTGHEAIAALLAGGTLVAGALLLRRLRARGQAAGALRRLPQRTEAQTWRQLRQACRRGDALAADGALRALLAALDADTRQRWLQEADLAAARVELGRLRFGPGAVGGAARPAGAGWRGDALWQVLHRLRRDARDAARPPGLPTLHP